MKLFWSIVVGFLILKSIAAQDIIFPIGTSERLGERLLGDCFTPKKEQGQCIPLNSCRQLLNLLTKTALTNSDRYFLRRSQCGHQGGEVLFCCSSREGSRAGLVDGASLLPAPGQCGTGNFDKIIGGQNTAIDEFPWMALLNYDKPEGKKGFHCGGFLINNRYVLTAAHCVKGIAIPANWRLSSVRLGEWDTNTEVDCDDGDCNHPPIDIPIEDFIIHENFQRASKDQLHDIALLRLSRPVNYTGFIKPICLPSAQHLRDATFEGVSLDVAGWGMTENASRSNVKLKTTVKGVKSSDCQGIYKRKSVLVQDTQLCAGGEKGVDSCIGDSGGPLMGLDFTNPTRPFLFSAGIVSYGSKPCGQEGWPAVHTRVGSYIDWIKSKIRP